MELQKNRKMAQALDECLDFRPIPGPRRRALTGLLISAVGHGAFLIGFFCMTFLGAGILLLPVAYFEESVPFTAIFLLMLVAGVGVTLLPGGVILVRYGRKMRSRDALEVLRKDRRKPVLYLRSFEDEDILDPTFRSAFQPGNWPNPFIPQRYEERLTRALRRVGPVISIGIPGERRPELGAARLYVGDDEWQAAVAQLARSAALVVIVVGRTSSLWWEIQFVFENIDRRRILLFFPYADEPAKRRTLWNLLRASIPGVIPRKIWNRLEADRQARYHSFCERMGPRGFVQWPPELGEAQFVHFLNDGRPALLPTRRSWDAHFYRMLFRRSVQTWIDVPKTLRPVVKAFTLR